MLIEGKEQRGQRMSSQARGETHNMAQQGSTASLGRLIARAAFVASVACVMPAPLTAADYPNRPIHIVVPWPAGGPTDAVARVLAREMSETLRQSLVIDNKAGATGVIGSDAVAKSPPDGYTIVVAGTASHPLAKIANAKLPYDPLKDFRPIVEYGSYPVAMVASTALSVKDLSEFVAYSKTAKDGLLIGIPGVGALSHVYGQLLASKTGAKLTFVPYRGDAPARLDLLAGNIHGISSTPDFGLIADGKARLIGSTGTKRWPQTADVPTFAEAGYPDLVASITWGFAAPKGTPDEIIKVLNEAANRALQVESVRKVMADNAYFPSGGPPDALWSAFAKQISEFEKLAAAGLIKVE
jgi:tripartite-type tricarboxylate transporter receptor subunit TctC